MSISSGTSSSRFMITCMFSLACISLVVYSYLQYSDMILESLTSLKQHGTPFMYPQAEPTSSPSPSPSPSLISTLAPLYTVPISSTDSASSSVSVTLSSVSNSQWEFNSDVDAFRYVVEHNNTFIVHIYPMADTKYDDVVVEMLNKIGRIIYRKEVWLKNNGPMIFTQHLYGHEKWFKEKNARAQCHKVFFGNLAPHAYTLRPMRIYLLSLDNSKGLNHMKEKIREVYGVEKASCHINDYHWQAIISSTMVLNDNSISFLNNAKYSWLDDRNRPLKDLYLEDIRRRKPENQDYFSPGKHFVVSQGTLSAYGIVGHNVPLYIISNDKHTSELKYDDIVRSDNRNLNWYSNTASELVYNPKYHFYCDGFKFLIPAVLAKLYRSRNFLTDKQDLERLTGANLLV